MWVLEALMNQIHSKLYDVFVFTSTDDEKLFNVISNNQPKSLNDWWINESFEGSKTIFESPIHQESLDNCIKLLKKMYLFKNPNEKYENLLKIRNVIKSIDFI